MGHLGGSVVRHPTLDSSSGLDLMVRELEPLHQALRWTEPAWGSLSLSLSHCPACSFSLSQINKNFKKHKYIKVVQIDQLIAN